MPSQVYWIEEPWIIAAEYSGKISVADVESVMLQCLEIVEDHPVYFLVDFTMTTGLDPGIFKMTLPLKLIQHPNSRWFACVGVGGIIMFAAQIFMRLAPVKMFRNREGAVSLLRSMTDASMKSVADLSVSSAD